jgi:hypothetical protein
MHRCNDIYVNLYLTTAFRESQHEHEDQYPDRVFG